MNFEITSETSRQTIKAESWDALRVPAGTIKVEQLDRKQLQRDLRAANVELAKLGREYLSASELNERLNGILERNGFETLDRDVTPATEMRCVPIGRGIHLAVTTYRMPSGRFEFVGYLS